MKIKPQKQCHFQEVWLGMPQFSDWLKRVENNEYEASCTVCRTVFSLSNMGKNALRSHMDGKKHLQATSSAKKSSSLQCFFKPPTAVSSTTPSTASAPSTTPPSGINPVHNETPRGLQSFVLKADVTKAEILSCLQYVMTPKLSMRSTANLIKLDPIKYPDSAIAKKVQLGKDKIGYSVNHGLAPYFHQNLEMVLLSCEYYVLCFDESFNKICEKTQMDLSFRFWDKNEDLVVTRYFNSMFLGSQKAPDLIEGIEKGMAPLLLKKLLQLSIDGPFVNLKVFNDLQQKVRSSPNDPYILFIGTCGLHTSNNAFKRCFVLVGWDMSVFLSVLYHLFHKSPARRALYILYAESNVFPLQFCKIRWLENSGAAERGIFMLPGLHKFVKKVEENKKDAATASSYYFQQLKKCLQDPLLSLKLTFFKFIATEVEPFLTEFQKNEPLIPFLFRELNTLLYSFMERFIDPKVLENNAANVSNIDLSDKETFIPAKKIDLGLETSKAFRALPVQPKDGDVLKFRIEAKKIMTTFCTLMLEKSPLHYPLTKYLSALDPRYTCKTLGRTRFKSLIETFVEKNWLTPSVGEKAIKEYKALFSCPTVIERCSSYSRSKQRIDSFYVDLFELKKNELVALPKVVKLSLIFSHGNAFVEQGFSINKELLETNLKEESVVARRTIYDEVGSMEKLQTFEITKPLMNSFGNAHKNFSEATKIRQANISEEDARKIRKRKAEKEIKELEIEEKALKKDSQVKLTAIKTKIELLKKGS